MHRRNFLNCVARCAASAAILPAIGATGLWSSASASGTRGLRIVSRALEVNRRSASVFAILDEGGRSGLTFREGETFDVALRNDLAEPSILHWHGLKPPVGQDGVPDMPQPMLKPGETRRYSFPVGRAGTHWMHAHTLQEQALLAAPLIVGSTVQTDEQEVVMLLHDFSFTPAAELLARLRKATGGAHAGHAGGADVNDIEYDAYLANDRTLADPQVVRVENGGRVRLRIINGATATVFTIDTGEIEGELIAVDGQDILPVSGRRFPIAMGQRIDIRLSLPKSARAFPILALREGAMERTGLVLAPPGASVAKIAATGQGKGPVMGLDLEARLSPTAPLAARAADRVLHVALTGGMAGYTWGVQSPGGLTVRKGERVRLVMQNASMMAHPMHLHGHHFQVVGLNGRALNGAVRDTVHVPPMSEVTIAFDADNSGTWAFHCHHLYHMAAGMMAMLAYDGAA